MSKKIKINTIYRVSVANVLKDSNSDFLDALSSDPNANTYYFGLCDDVSKVIVYHEDIGNVSLVADSLDKAVDELLKLPLKGGYPEQIQKPIMLAAIHNDSDILADAFEKETFRFYSVSELDEVADYKSRIEGLDAICGFGAVSYDTEVYFDPNTSKFTYDDDAFDNLSDLQGYFDEDAWVVVLRPYQSSGDDSSARKNDTPEENQKGVTKFCTECGVPLSDSSKFCASCGAKIAQDKTIDSMPPPEFKKTALDTEKFKIEVSSVNVEGPDNENNYSITIKYIVENNTDIEFDCVQTHVVLINSEGLLIDERSSTEDEVEKGGSLDLDTYFWNIPTGLLGNDPTKISVMIEVIGCYGSKYHLGTLSIPAIANQPAALPTFNLDERVRGLTGSIWKSLPDSDKDVTVNAKISLQNLTDSYITQVNFNAKVLDSEGDELVELSGSEDLKPASLLVLGGYGYAKEKRLKSATIKCSVSYAEPVARSFVTHTGSQVVAIQVDDGSEEDIIEDNESDAFASLAAALGSRPKAKSSSRDFEESEIVVRFALTKGEGRWPSRDELSDEEIKNPSSFCYFNLSVEGDNTPEILSCEVIYDGVTYSEALEQGLRIDEDSLEGYPTPIIKFYLSDPVDPKDFVKMVWMSTVSLKPKSREKSGEDPFYCEDMNGYTEFITDDQVEEIKQQLALDGLCFGKKYSPANLNGYNMDDFISENGLVNDSISSSLEPKKTGGSFEINVFGRGGETVVGRISKSQFDYWDDHRDDIDDHLSSGGDDVSDEFNLGEWSDHDDVAHCSGADFSASQTRIQVIDASGKEIWSIDADRDLLEEKGIEVELQDEMAIYQLPPGFYFCGRSFEKGSFFSAKVETNLFDPKKLKFEVRDVNEWVLLVSVFYDGEELDGSDGYNTTTYSSEFFVEESES